MTHNLWTTFILELCWLIYFQFFAPIRTKARLFLLPFSSFPLCVCAFRPYRTGWSAYTSLSLNNVDKSKVQKYTYFKRNGYAHPCAVQCGKRSRCLFFLIKYALGLKHTTNTDNDSSSRVECLHFTCNETRRIEFHLCEFSISLKQIH